MNCYIATWKPEVGAYSKRDFDALKVHLRQHRFVCTNWRMSTTTARAGDSVLIFRQGKETGLMGFGEVESPSLVNDDGARRCAIRIHNLRDSNEAPYLTKQALTDAGISVSVFNTQASDSRALKASETAVIDSLCRSSIGYPLANLCGIYLDFRQR